MNQGNDKLFHSAREELSTDTLTDQFVAFADQEFLLREELRPVRLQLELLKPELIQQDQDIHSTIVFFGSARIPDPTEAKQRLEQAENLAKQHPNDYKVEKQLVIARNLEKLSHYFNEAHKLGHMAAEHALNDGQFNVTVATGGGPGIMEAANKGAFDAGAKTLGLNIVIPHEQAPNPYVTPELSFPFHYFAIRKMHFLIRAKALIAFPGGFGTLDEIFDALTLLQTKKMEKVPFLLFGKDYWKGVLDFDFLVEQGTISEEDLGYFTFVETAEEAWSYLKAYYQF